MISKTFRVALIAAACLGMVGATRLAIQGSTPTRATDSNSSSDQEHGTKDLIQNSGYMVAVG